VGFDPNFDLHAVGYSLSGNTARESRGAACTISSGAAMPKSRRVR
jgi:hypothetical protein